MTANQLYKQSGTDLTFKDWLKKQQKIGTLEIREPLMASGYIASKNDNKHYIYLGVGLVLGVGLGYYLSKKK
jgi:hypothetical protein